jgi:hypothetical protein
MQKMNRALMIAILAGSCFIATNASAEDERSGECAVDEICANGAPCVDGVCPADDEKHQCEVDADCEGGLICGEVDAGFCDETPDGSQGCSTELIRTCVPPRPDQCDPALLSADCSGGQVCVTYTFESCSGAEDCACPVDEPCNCAEPDEPACQSGSESYCVPSYIAPCSNDADCGDGFACQTNSSGQDQRCELIERPCAADAECGDGFVCAAPPAPNTGTCSTDVDGETNCIDDAPSETAQAYCLPEGWEQWGGQPGSVEYDIPSSSNSDGELIGAQPARPSKQDPSDSTLGDDVDAQNTGCTAGGTAGGAGTGLGLLALMTGMLGWRRRRD